MHLRGRLSSLALIAATAGGACDAPPVRWSDPVPLNEMTGPTRLVVDSSGHAMAVADVARVTTPPASPGLCTTSLRTIPGRGRMFSAWWNVRRDSSAALLIASSADSGRSWGKAVAVDTTDVSSAGCSRPPPSVATVGDDLFVAYSMIAVSHLRVAFDGIARCRCRDGARGRIVGSYVGGVVGDAALERQHGDARRAPGPHSMTLTL